MKLALEQAVIAQSHGDVPVGAVLVAKHRNGDQILALGHNRREIDQDPVAHAEIVALREAAAKRGHWRLEDTCLYVTLEPCAMCAGALVNARVPQLVYAALDPKAGAVTSLMNIGQDSRLNHRFEVTHGILKDECSQILKDFFRRRRSEKRLQKRLQRGQPKEHGQNGPNS